MESYELTVDIALSNGVCIGNGKLAHAGSCEHLGSVGANTSKANNKNVGSVDDGEFLFAQK
jgi:hypothetical protein